MTETHRIIKRCAHCGERFGYWIDDKFYPVAWHKHKVDDAKIRFYPDGRKEVERKP